MKIEYVVMEIKVDGAQVEFGSLSIDNSFPSAEAAEAAIADFFKNSNRRSDGLVLFVLKLFKAD